MFVRDDATARWQRSDIVGGNLGVRSFGSHVDKATGVHHLFAGLNRGGIHRGSHDPAAPGGIRWEPLPERTAEALPGKGRRVYDHSRVLCFAECNGDLYMASRITTGEDGKPVDGGLYRRVDGPQPKWELVHRWTIDKDVLQSRFLRGLTTVPDPKGGKHEVLIANFEYPGTIARFDPTRPNVTAEQELDIKEFFNQAWNTPAAPTRSDCRLQPVLARDRSENRRTRLALRRVGGTSRIAESAGQRFLLSHPPPRRPLRLGLHLRPRPSRSRRPETHRLPRHRAVAVRGRAGPRLLLLRLRRRRRPQP